MASILKVDTIQDQDGNNIINESANTITIGASGDTITIPSGATLANSGIVTGFESTGIDDNATSTAITIDSSQNVGIAGNINLGDNDKAQFGASNDLQIYHNGLASYIKEAGTGNLSIGGDNEVYITNSADNEFKARFITDGAVELYYDNSKKFETTSTGATVTGNLTASGNLTSLGIDDNATSTAITIDSSEHTHFGLTSAPTSGQGGATIHNYGSISTSRTSTVNFDHHLFYNPNGQVGNIKTQGSDLNINASSSLTFYTNNTEKMRINSSGNVGIGTSSPVGKLDVVGGIYCDGLQVDGNAVIQQTTGDVSLTLAANENGSNREPSLNLKGYNSSSNPIINFGDNSGYPGNIEYENQDNSMRLYTNSSEAMRIDSSGNLLINTTSQIEAGKLGVDCGVGANGIDVSVGNTGGGNTAVRIFRTASDGDLISMSQGGTLEGTISVSGSTVSYNGFTGTHWSRFQDNSTPTILRGTVLESLDEMCDWYNLEFDVITQDENGNDVTTTKKIPHVLTDTQSNGDTVTYNHEGTDYQATIVKEVDVKHMMSKVSDNSNAKNVYGLFVAYDLDGEGYNDFFVASVGSYVVRIKQGETIAKGDLLQSNGDGTAKVQTDDAVRSSSFAKVLSTTIIETYDDGSYLVPCSLMC